MNILLITSARNNDRSATWLVLSKFVKHMRDKLSSEIQIICLPPLFYSKSGELREKVFNTFLRNEKLVSVLRRVNKKYLWLISILYAKIYTPNIIAHIRKCEINKLWVEADLLSLLLLKEILKKKQIQYHISVFDDVFFYQGYLPFENKIFSLKDLFYNAKSIDTPTNELYEFYKENKIINTETKTVESFVGVFKDSITPPKINNVVKKIALTGSIYGIDALYAFILAVKDILLSDNIEFHFMTKTYNYHIKYLKSIYKEMFKHIKVIPFIPENNLISELQNYDLLYLPMRFDKNYRFQTNSSFPSKTHNYLASQIPIIVHTPNSSALYNFFTNHQIGCVIDTLNSDEILNAFQNMLDKKNREIMSYEIRKCNEILVQNNHIKKLYNIINETES